ncbi:MAG: hypothetical protein KDB22_26810, partial [Planctomycetales bacterium]|nr:hypothetical protein [Planctomycetales bacterium]
VVEAERPEDCTRVLVDTELDGDILSAGAAFWRFLESQSGWLKACLDQGPPTSIEYSDRYVRSPLSVRVLFELIKRFASTSSDRTELKINTTASPQLQTGHALHHDWRDDGTQKAVLQDLFKAYFHVSVKVYARPHELSHSRFLSIRWTNGFHVEINLDQGVGFYRTKAFKGFDFSLPPESQAQRLAALRFSVENQSASMPLYILKPSWEHC